MKRVFCEPELILQFHFHFLPRVSSFLRQPNPSSHVKKMARNLVPKTLSLPSADVQISFCGLGFSGGGKSAQFSGRSAASGWGEKCNVILRFRHACQRVLISTQASLGIFANRDLWPRMGWTRDFRRIKGYLQTRLESEMSELKKERRDVSGRIFRKDLVGWGSRIGFGGKGSFLYPCW